MALDQADLDAIQLMINNSHSQLMTEFGMLHGEVGNLNGAINSSVGTVTYNIVSSLDGIHDHLDILATSINEYSASVGSSSDNLAGTVTNNIISSLDGIHQHLDTLGTTIDEYAASVGSGNNSSVLLQSLNGNFGSYPNGTVCQTFPSSRDYTVSRSYFFENDSSKFLIMYELLDSNGCLTVVPHDFVVIPVPEEVS